MWFAVPRCDGLWSLEQILTQEHFSDRLVGDAWNWTLGLQKPTLRTASFDILLIENIMKKKRGEFVIV